MGVCLVSVSHRGKAPGLENGPSHCQDWEIIKAGWRNAGKNKTKHNITPWFTYCFKQLQQKLCFCFCCLFSFFPPSLPHRWNEAQKARALSASVLHRWFVLKGQTGKWTSNYDHKYNWIDKPLPEIKPLFTVEHTSTSDCTTAKSIFVHLQQGLVLPSLHE